MHIVQIAAELAPIAKVGGLGDVVFGLSRQLQKNGHRSEVIIPKYDITDLSKVDALEKLPLTFSTTYDGQSYTNHAWKALLMDTPVFFLETEHPAAFFNRGSIYSCSDDVDRFLYFCRAALDFLQARGESPHILHTHDWQTAIIAPLLKEQYREKALKHSKVVHTLHNLEHQGVCSPSYLSKLSMDPEYYMQENRLKDPFNCTSINLLKGSIVYADAITTVSPSYAQEIKAAEGGRGLESTILQHAERFSGVLNGIDNEYWNPQVDSYLPSHYSLDGEKLSSNGQFSLRNKRLVKRHLQRTLGLTPSENKPLVAVISRLVPQKGTHLIRHGLHRTLEKGGQFILLGSSPIPQLQAEFSALREQFSQSPDARLEMTQSETLAHLIFAGADIFLVPSLFEPCGLTQLIAMRYGTLPVVRSTGGLADTVFDADYSNKPFEERNGYTFEHTDEQALNSALDRAMHCWSHHPEIWWKLMRNAMAINHGWSVPAQAYEKIYKSLCPPKAPSRRPNDSVYTTR